MHRLLRLVMALAPATLLLAVLSVPVSAATDVLTAGGTNVAVGDNLTGMLSGSATFGSVKCTQSSMTINVLSNPPAPGTATGSITSWTFGSCTSNAIGVSSAQLTVGDLPYNITLNDSVPPAIVVSSGPNGPIRFALTLQTSFGNLSCVYQPNGGTISGTQNNANSGIGFTNVQFNKVSGPGTCPSTASFSARYILEDGIQPVLIN